MDLLQLLTDCDDVRLLAGVLGAYVIEHSQEIVEELVDAQDERLAMRLEDAAAGVERAVWLDGRRLPEVLQNQTIARELAVLSARPPLVEWALLRAACASGLRYWFEEAQELVPLDFGDPYPLVSRPVGHIFDALTPAPWTLGHRGLLAGTGFDLFDRARGSQPVIELDYRTRVLLDGATWVREQTSEGEGGASLRLPRIATVHPHADFEQDMSFDADPGRSWWFDVAPVTMDVEAVLSRLAEAGRHAEVAVLPELSMQHPDQLREGLQDTGVGYPRLVVAGSAHVRRSVDGRERRTNESVTYLHGVEVLRHEKLHPLVLHRDGLEWPEGLTRGASRLRLLSGSSTRLAVLICADLNDSEIPGLLQRLGTNLLLVPSMTETEGGFCGAASILASLCQGVTLVVNGAPPLLRGNEEPFMLLAGVPDRRADRQTGSYMPPDGAWRARGLFDPNVPLAEAVTWQEW